MYCKNYFVFLGVQLFRRLNRGMELTAAARIALPQLTAGFETCIITTSTTQL
jgi:DNA-binding transcriptional LysR family regulator